MRGYKGFSKNFKCRGMQYEVGKTFEEKGAVLCKHGLHFCEYPLDVFTYYAPSHSKYAVVEADGVSDETDDDSKRVSTKLQVKAEISLLDIAKASVEYIKENLKYDKQSNTGNCSAATNTGDCSAATNTGNRSAATNTGNRSAATNTGYCSAATNTGNRSAATNTGNCSAAVVSGNESVAISLGIGGKAKGSVGCWIVLSEFVELENGFHRASVKSFYVDGEKIKADTFYTLINGEAVPADD